MTWTYSEEYYKNYTRDTWNESAASYGPFIRNLDRYNPPFFRLAAPSPGEDVLDVSTGPGEPALMLAQAVAPGGSVVGIDLSENMIEIAQRRAKDARLENLSFQVMDAEALEFDDGRFDLVTNRFGLQIFTDPDKAMEETFRVLGPGGRFATIVWASPGERVPHIHAIIGPMLEHAEPDETGYLPTPYEMGGEGELKAILEGIGFENVVEERHTFHYVFETVQAYMDALMKGTPLGHSLLEEDEEVQEEVLEKTHRNLEPYTFGGAVVIPGEAVYVAARRP